MTTGNEQIILLEPFVYAAGVQVTFTSTTTLTITAGEVRDSSNQYDITFNSSALLNGAANGVNGLDTGSLANNTWYYVYAIGDSTNFKVAATLISTSATAPFVPFGYDVKRLIGYVLTDGSAHFLKFYTVGSGTNRTNYWDAGISVLSAGTQTGSFAAVSLAAAVPPVDNTPVTFDISFQANAAGDGVSFRPTGSTATQVDGLTAIAVSHPQRLQMKILSKLSTNASIDYENSAASGSTTLFVRAFDYFI